MREITPRRVNSELKRLAKESPDAVYSNDVSFRKDTCSYTFGSAGKSNGCIFGQALVNLGVPVQTLREIDEEGVSTVAGIDEVCSRLGIKCDKRWSSIQNKQDQKDTWIESVSSIL